VIVRLCKAGLIRLGAPGAELVAELRKREHTPALADCLDRCQQCERQLVASLDGMPVAVPGPADLLSLVDELSD
jgi:hypothetical protein